jgi:hypothetical protein
MKTKATPPASSTAPRIGGKGMVSFFSAVRLERTDIKHFFAFGIGNSLISVRTSELVRHLFLAAVKQAFKHCLPLGPALLV